jgi:hypothetical protein
MHRIYSAEPITYIVSITPGTVLAVKAYKQFTGERRLIAVPSDLYRVETKVYGTVTAVQLVFNRPLSSIADQGWSDDVYVTFESTILKCATFWLIRRSHTWKRVKSGIPT